MPLLGRGTSALGVLASALGRETLVARVPILSGPFAGLRVLLSDVRRHLAFLTEPPLASLRAGVFAPVASLALLVCIRIGASS